MKPFVPAIAMLLTLAPSVLFAGQQSPSQAAFTKMKTLVGKWEGKMGDGPDAMPATVEFKLTGSDTALVETLGPGSPFEMVSVYHMDGDSLVMTHYCGAGNQPSMKLKPGKDANILFFDFYKGANMKPTDMHMHQLTYTFVSPDHVKAVWVSFANGKAADQAAFDFHRVKG